MAPFARTTVPAHLKHPGGRPSEYRVEYCDKVIEAAKNHGLSITAFAGIIGVARASIYEWIGAHREFSDACARAQSARVLWWELKMGKARKGAEVTASIFALKNAAPDEWRDVRHTEHKHSLSYDHLTDQQLRAIAAGVSPVDAGLIEGEIVDVVPHHNEQNDVAPVKSEH